MVGKVKITSPRKQTPRDLTNPDVIESIWAEAARAVRADRRTTLRVRRAQTA